MVASVVRRALCRPHLAGLLAVALAAAPAAGRAQSVGARAYVTPGTTVAVGASFVLNVEVTGTQTLDADPELPALEAFAQYLGSGTSTAMQIVNGRSSVSRTIQYRFQAMREGTFDIPAVTVRAEGGTHSTEPIRLTISSAPAPQAGGAPGAGNRAPTEGGLSPEDLFVTAEASRSRVREGEPFVVEYRIWSRVDITSYGFTRLPELAGFWVEELDLGGAPQVEQLTRNGVNYASAVIRRVALVPTGAGERTIEPVGVEAEVRVRRNDDPFDRFFGGGGFFGTTSVPAAVVSNALTIAVDPLPAGRPQPFSGVVGSLEVSASLDRDSVAVSDAVTLTVRVSGEGNIGAVPAPVLGLPPDFESFPPEIADSVRATDDGLRGSKTFAYVLLPRAPGRREIPAITLAYFDAAGGTYRNATTDALPLTVTGTAAAGAVAGGRGGVTALRQDIRFIHLATPVLRPVDQALVRGAAFWMFALLPMAGVAGALALRRHRDRIEGDVAYARGRRASRLARKRLAEARRLSTGDDARAFYSEVARALRGFVADKLNVPEAGMQIGDLRALLARARVPDATTGELVDCLEHCDRQRFAPPTPEGERARFLERAGMLMTSLDRDIRR